MDPLLLPQRQNSNVVGSVNGGLKSPSSSSLRLDAAAAATDLETNEATLASAGVVAASARRFREDLSTLRCTSSRRNRSKPVYHHPPTPPHAPLLPPPPPMIVNPEPMKIALLELREEEEEEEEGEKKVNAERGEKNNGESGGVADYRSVLTSSMRNGRLSREAFIERSREQLAPPESVLASVSSSSPATSGLIAALSTALSRCARQVEGRRAAEERCMRLRRRVDTLATDLDVAVDALRRLQRAQVTAGARNHNPSQGNEQSTIPANGCASCAEREHDMVALRLAVERLEGRNRCLQLRLQQRSASAYAATFGSAEATGAAVVAENGGEREGESGGCGNCRRLEKLVTILQNKRGAIQPDVIPSSKPTLCDEAVQTKEVDAVVIVDKNTLPSPPQSREIEAERPSLFSILESGGVIPSSTSSEAQRSPQFPVAPPFSKSTISAENRESASPGDEHSKGQDQGGEVERLRERLRQLERAAEASADQVRASNEEFLQLRERLTTAAIEKAHLAAELDGLQDRVTHLEGALEARSAELRASLLELEGFKRPLPCPASSSCVLRIEDDNVDEEKEEPLIHSPPRTVLRQTASKLQKVVDSFEVAVATFLNQPVVARVGRACSSTASKVARTVDYRVLGSRGPRVVVFLALLGYLCFLHIVLANCLFQ